MEWIILSLLCALVTSLIIVISKNKIYNYESIEFSASTRIWVMIFSIPFFIYLFKTMLFLSYEKVIIIYIGSLVDSIAYWLTFKSVKHIDMERISPFLNLEVVFVLIFAYFFFSEMPSLSGIIGIIIIFISICLIEYKTKIGFRKIIKNLSLFKYTLIIILATAYYGLFKILSRYILYYKSVNFFIFVTLLNIFNAINTLIILLIVEDIDLISFVREKFMMDKTTIMIGILILTQILTEYSAYALAPKSAYVSAIKMMYVIFALFISHFIYKEKYNLATYLISIFSFVGVLMIILH